MTDAQYNYRLFYDDVTERILLDLHDGSLAADDPSELEVKKIGRKYLERMDRSKGAAGFLAGVLMRYWSREAEACPWDEDTLTELLTEVQRELWEQRDLEEVLRVADAERRARAKRRDAREKAAAERAALDARRRDAELNKTIAREFNVSVRQARVLRAEGTVDFDRAARLAAILGTSPENHFRRKLRRGRKINLVKLFTELPVDEVSFARFVADETDELHTNELMKFLRSNACKSTNFQEMRCLEELIQFSRILGFPRPALDLTEEVWKSYQSWRILTISRIAMYDVQEGI